MVWTLEELDRAVEDFPTLRVVGPSSVQGILSVCGALRGQSLVLNPTEEDLSDPGLQATFLVDSFEVEIDWTGAAPSLKVLGSRLSDTAARQGMNLIDLHAYADGSVCFAAPQQVHSDQSQGLTLSQFVWNYVLPFLYEQAFFERHHRWPWGELAHGPLGLMEWLGRKKSPTNGDVLRTIWCLESLGASARALIGNRARRHHQCPCGSRKRLHECHPDVKPGIDLVRSWIFRGESPSLLKLARINS